MFGNSITLNVGTIADPVAKILPRINQDGYSSEYQLKDSDRTYQLQIRHSTEKSKVNGQTLDRHNVLVREYVLPTELAPQGSLREAYVVLRMPNSENQEGVASLLNGLFNLVNDVPTQTSIINWES